MNHGWEWRCYEIHGGSSYLSQNHVRIHFGLGKAASSPEFPWTTSQPGQG